MTSAPGADNIRSNGGARNRLGPPLLHLRGSEYGLRIFGLQRDDVSATADGEAVVTAVDVR